MSFFYLIGVVGNRVIGLFNILLLAYLLSPSAFGSFALASTNVLMAQVLIGWWLTSSAYKFLTHSDPIVVDGYISSFAASSFAVSTIAAIATFIVAMVFGGTLLMQAFLMSLWLVSLVNYDLTLAANNALGQSRSYAALSITRNCTALLISIGLVLAGYGATGAIAGQVVGTLAPLFVVPAASRFWLRARTSLVSLSHMREMLAFGFAGAFSLGYYTLVQGLGRNAVEARIGIAEAGQYALALDLFVAPAILLGTSFSLSRMRSLYQLGGSGSLKQAQTDTTHQLEVFTLFSIPYIFGGAVIGSELVSLVLSDVMQGPIASIASAAAAQAGIIAITNAVVSAMLVFDQRRRVVAYVVGIALANFGAIWWAAPAGLAAASWASVIATGAGLLIGLALGRQSGCFLIRWRWFAAVCASSLGCALACLSQFDGLGFREPISAAILGALVFAMLMAATRQIQWKEFGRTRGLSFLPSSHSLKGHVIGTDA